MMTGGIWRIVVSAKPYVDDIFGHSRLKKKRIFTQDTKNHLSEQKRVITGQRKIPQHKKLPIYEVSFDAAGSCVGHLRLGSVL